MSGLPRGRGGRRGYGNGWRGRSSTDFGYREIGRGKFNDTLNGGGFNNFLGGRGRGVGYGLPVRGMGDDDRREESSSVPEHRIPKGPKADRQEKEDASAVPQQDARTENDGIKDNPQLIPTEPKADRLVKTWQAGTRPVPEQNARPRDDWFKNLYLIPKEPKADRLAKSRQADTKLVPEQDAHIKNDWNKRKQQPIPTEPKADRLAKSRQTEIERDLHRDAARRGYILLRPIQKHPRRESIGAHPTPTHIRSRSPEEEQEFNSSFPPLPPSPAATVRPPLGNQPPTSVTPSATPSARPARREACSTNPTERTFRKVSANSLSTPSASSDGDDGNLYDPNKTEEEKEKIRQEINEHNRGLLVPPWSGPNLGPEMQDIERG